MVYTFFLYIYLILTFKMNIKEINVFLLFSVFHIFFCIVTLFVHVDGL
jgi:hypothetical protein